jgi:hypothetical protein
VERYDHRCSGRILTFGVWAVYALAVAVRWQFDNAHGVAPGLSWLVASASAFGLLVATREI